MLNNPVLNRNTNIFGPERSIPNIIAVSENLGEATQFFYKLFGERPELFGMYGESLLYSLYAGHPMKLDTLQVILKSFIENRNILNSDKNPYLNAPSPIIVWAYVLAHTNQAIVYEPVMKLLNDSLNKFIDSPKVYYNRQEYHLNTFKPICYDKNGNNYCSMLPYIAYVICFLTRCRAYSFSDSFSKASNAQWNTSMEQYFMTILSAFKRDHHIDLLSDHDIILKNSNDELLKIMIEQSLNPNKIIKVRNEIMNLEKGLMEENKEDQDALKQEDIDLAFMETLNMIISYVVEFNPIRHFIDKAPLFNPDNLNILNLSNLTLYALSGGNAQFCINDTENFKPYYIIENANVEPFNTFGKQTIKTKIEPLNQSIKMPFTSADIYLNIVASAVKNKFESLFSDPLGGKEVLDIHINEYDFDNACERISGRLSDLIAQGLWFSYGNSMHNNIDKNMRLSEDLTNTRNLCSVLKLMYGNKNMGTCATPIYILSMVPQFLMEHVKNNQPLDTFKLFEYVYAYDIKMNLMKNISDSIISMLYLDNENYVKFVNIISKECTDLLHNGLVVIPYIKGLEDMADAYAIGGIDLYSYAPIANPLVRSCEIVKNIFGTCEELNRYERIMSQITNSSVFDVVEDGIYDSVLKPALDRIQIKPETLSDYVFSKDAYKPKETISILESSVGNQKITELASKYIYKKSDAANLTIPTLYTRTLAFKNDSSKVDVGKIVKNSFVIADSSNKNTFEGITPLYDIKGEMKRVLVEPKVNVKGGEPEQIEMFSPTNERNMIVWIFSEKKFSDRFGIKAKMNKM